MLTLPFKRISRAEQLLDEFPIDDLVLIFSRQSDDRHLIVYNKSILPNIKNHDHEMKRLNDLQPDDYRDFDGPILGFSALDVVFPDIPTRGVNFYHLFHAFENRRLLSEYKNTAFNLAKWMLTERQQFSGQVERGYSKVLELALPRLLSDYSMENLVATVIDPDFENLIKGKHDSLQRIYVEDLEHLKSMPRSDQYVIAFEELMSHDPLRALDKSYWFDIRLLFGQLGQSAALRKTCLSLARYNWNQWQISRKSENRTFAYSLAGEAWLMNRDAEDLIAILPHTDFERFVDQGDAVRVDRIPHINVSITSDDRRFSLTEIEDSTRFKDAISNYQGLPISFQAISPIISSLVPGPVLNLAMVLYHARKETELARTLLLVSSDLLRFAPLSKIGPSSEQITNMAQRATLIYSMSNPWHKFWRARYSYLIGLAYSHLDECIANQEQRVRDGNLSDYYRALRAWYGCYLSQDKPHSLAAVQDACRDFLNANSGRGGLEDKKAFAKQLYETADRLLRPNIIYSMGETTDFSSRFEVVDYIRDIVQEGESAKVFSANFIKLLNVFGELHTQWHNLQHNISGQPVGVVELNKLKNDYTTLQNIAYAPAHELRLIQWACQRDVVEINSWAQGLQLGPIIEIQVLNHQMIKGKVERLSVEVKNAGSEPVRDFEISLMPSQQFELASNPMPFMLSTFDIGQSSRVALNIRILNSPVILKFSFRYKTLDGQFHSDEVVTSPVEAISAKTAGIPPRVNPFQAGNPVYGNRFFGRTKELKEIFHNLLGGISQPVLLRGPRRIGKSSILRHVQYLLTTEGEIRSMGFSLEEELALRQFHPILASLQGIPSEQFIPGWFSGLFKEICQSLGELYDEEKMRRDFQVDPVREFGNYLNQLFRNRPELRLLVMIDEWDKQHHLADLGDGLRNIMQNEERVNWIVSSTWVLRAEASRFPSPFFGHGMVIELKDLVWSAATQLVQNLSNRAGVDWHGDAMVTLLDQTARRPYLVQLLCQQVITYLVNQKRPSTLVDSDVIGRVIGNFITTPQTSGQALGFLWENSPLSSVHTGEARLHWLGRLILLEMDRSPIDLTYLQIKEHLWNSFGKRNLPGPNENFFNEEFIRQIPELEYIFDMIRYEPPHIVFSVPLARSWFHQTLSQYPDPYFHAYTGMMQDYEEWKKSTSPEEEK